MSTNEPKPLLMMDWGIGGLSVYAALKRRFAKLDVVYFSDTGALPYGKQKPGELAARLDQLIELARARFSCVETLIACNAASTAIPDLNTKIPVRGMIEAGARLVRASGHRKIGIIGGNRTIESGVFLKALESSGVALAPVSAQPLSALVEAGRLDGEETEREVSAVLEKLPGVNTILLACTHYPALAPTFRKLRHGLTLLDPAEMAAAEVDPGKFSSTGHDLFFTTGDIAAMESSARLAFGLELVARKLRLT